nr:hypothetical protein [Tanacetum cinerariifolium]
MLSHRFKTLIERFEGIQKALTKEIKEIFEELEAEVDQNVMHRKHDEIERKNLLIVNENLIADCLSKDVFYNATDYVLIVSRFSDMHESLNAAQKRIAELDLKILIYKTRFIMMIKIKSVTSSDSPTFDSVFVIGKLKDQIQSRGNTIRKLREKISRLTMKHSETVPTHDSAALDSQTKELHAKINALHDLNKSWRAENEIAQLTEHQKSNCVTMPAVKSKVLIPDMYDIDMEPIPPRIRNNREARLDYLNHLKKSIETLREIVEEAKVESPLDRSLASAYLYTKHFQELLEFVIGTCSKDFNQRDKKHAAIPVTRKKQVTFMDLGCSKHMTRDCSRLRKFVKKFIGTVRFRKDYVEGLGHNLFSVKKFCDSDLEVAFRKHSCYVHDTDGVELIKGSRGFNLYTISVEDMIKSSPICLLSKSFKTKSWLWHHRLNHLNFGTINDLARKDLVRGLPRLKFEKYHLSFACQLEKSKKHTHSPKAKTINLEVLNTLHMDLCGPIRVQKINGKKYILVIVDDYTRFIWVKFFRSKDETPEQLLLLPVTPKADLSFTLVITKPYMSWCTIRNLILPFSRKGYKIYNKRTRRIIETIHVQFNELYEPIAPVQLIPVLVNSVGTPSSTSIDQDAHSLSHSPSSSALQSPCSHQGIAAESTLMDVNLFALVDNDPFINIFASGPTYATSSSGDASSAESPYVTQTLYHLRK